MKKKLKFYPRYVGDFSDEHFTTPRRRKTILNLLKCKYLQQTKKVKSLQQQNRNLKKKVLSLQSLINELQQKCLISENAAHTLMVCSS